MYNASASGQLPAVSIPSKFVGMHYSSWSGGTPTPAVTYAPKIWRSLGNDVNWADIESSDNVFTGDGKAKLDDRVAYFAAQGQDIYYQIYETPAHCRVAGQSWAAVTDQDGQVGAGCVPDTVKLARFVTWLLTTYPQIKYLSPWNEPKWATNPAIKVWGTNTGLAVGDSVVGLTSGATGTVSTIGSQMVIRYTDAANVATPFSPGAETIQKVGDASKYWTATSTSAIWYWFGTKAELVTHCQTVYAAAKAANPNVLVTWPDFVEGGGSEEQWIETWLDAGGSNAFDVGAYHFYGYDIRDANLNAVAYSLPARCDSIDAILAARGISCPLIASECGAVPGWAFYDSLSKGAQAQTLKRVTAYLAARGWLGVIWYGHSNTYCGNPSVYPEISQALNWLQQTLGGKTISGAYVAEDNTLRMLVDGNPVTL